MPKSNIADFRVVKGTAVYTAEFTPPTAPLTAITNTKLLVQMQMQVSLIKHRALNEVYLFGNVSIYCSL